MRLPTLPPHQTLLIQYQQKLQQQQQDGTNSRNITFQEHRVTREERWAALGSTHGGCTLWFTGLSGAGKTTVAFALENILTRLGITSYGLDGDNVRHGLCKDLGFSKQDRSENIRRVAEVARLFADMGVIVVASFISPSRTDRDEARRIHEESGLKFFEVYVNTPFEVCEKRDPKRLYEKARAGHIPQFTGIGAAYEPPKHPDLVLNTENCTEADCVQEVLQFLYDQHCFSEKMLYDNICGTQIRELFVRNHTERMAQMTSYNMGRNLVIEIELSMVDLQWLQILAEGWATPLGGFMRERQYLQCLHHGQLLDLKRGFDGIALDCVTSKKHHSQVDDYVKQEDNENGKITGKVDSQPDPSEWWNVNGSDKLFTPINQSIPIVLPITDEQKERIGNAEKVYLTYEGQIIAVVIRPEVYQHRKEERIGRVFGHASIPAGAHPVVDQIRASGDFLLGGDLKVLVNRIRFNDGLDEYRKTPQELREFFAAVGADAVFAFQLRNPIHNGHVLLMKATREELIRRGYQNPVLLLHPLGGWTKPDDVPLMVRIAQHRAVLQAGMLDPRWTVLAIFPSPMLYAGPTEVQWHARARLACGINFYIVGRDPAGIKNAQTGSDMYEATHGAKVLSMATGLPSCLEVLPFRVAAYNLRSERMEFFDPDHPEDYKFISGTLMRELARRGETPPIGFMCPQAWKIVADFYRTIVTTI